MSGLTTGFGNGLRSGLRLGANALGLVFSAGDRHGRRLGPWLAADAGIVDGFGFGFCRPLFNSGGVLIDDLALSMGLGGLNDRLGSGLRFGADTLGGLLFGEGYGRGLGPRLAADAGIVDGFGFGFCRPLFNSGGVLIDDLALSMGLGGLNDRLGSGLRFGADTLGGLLFGEGYGRGLAPRLAADAGIVYGFGIGWCPLFILVLEAADVVGPGHGRGGRLGDEEDGHEGLDGEGTRELHFVVCWVEVVR